MYGLFSQEDKAEISAEIFSDVHIAAPVRIKRRLNIAFSQIPYELFYLSFQRPTDGND